LWREACPEAAAEPPSAKLRPLIMVEAGKTDSVEE
jgi:hypothetical protein